MPPWVSDEVPIRLTVFCAALLLPALIELTDEQFNAETAPGQWTYRAVAKHVLSPEQDSLEVGDMTISAQIAVYPLRQERLTPAVDAVRTALTAKGSRRKSAR